MKEAEKKRIQYLTEQIRMTVEDTRNCVNLLYVRTRMEMRAEWFCMREKLLKDIDVNLYNSDIFRLDDALEDISKSLSNIITQEDPTHLITNLKNLNTKIESLETLTNTFGKHPSDNPLSLKELYLNADVKAKTKTTLKQLKDTLVYCVRAVLRLVDNILHTIPWSKNYNDQGETPGALSLTGKTQFFPPPTSSIAVALKELQKANGVLKKTLEHLDNDNNQTSTPSSK